MLDPGDVVILNFPGATGTKRRPAVVVSTALYHAHRPDVLLGLLTTQVDNANTPTDYTLLDWHSAGLRQPSAFRSYLVTAESNVLNGVGKLSQRDWQGVQSCLSLAIASSLKTS